MAPARPCSISGAVLDALPFPMKPKFIGKASAAPSMRARLFGPEEVMPTVTGPRPPPIMVVIPLEMASSTRPALSKCTCTSMAPAVAIMPSPDRISVPAPMISSGSTPSMVRGLPALPTPTMRPSRMPISALRMPSTASMISALVITKSRAPSALVRSPWTAIPSRMVFPPPNTASSP